MANKFSFLGAIHTNMIEIMYDKYVENPESVNEEWRKKIDDEFKAVLEGVRQPYLTITGSPMQRVEQIMKFIQ